MRSRTSRSLRFALPLAGVLVASTASAAGVAPGQATSAQKTQATSRFVKGKDLFGQGKVEAALAEFAASFEIVASPNARLYMARCMRDGGHLAQAYAEYERVESDARALAKDDPKYEKAAEAAVEERQQLESKLGFVDLEVTNASEASTVKVGGEEIPRSAWSRPVAVNPGDAEVLLETPGRPPVSRSVAISSGEHKPVAVDAGPAKAAVEKRPETPPPPREPPERALRPYAWVTGGVAVVGLGTFAIAGVLSNQTYSDLQAACGTGPCPPSRQSDITRGKTEQTVANVGLAVAVVGAVATVTLVLLDHPKKDGPSGAATARVTAGAHFLGLEGDF